MGVNQETDTAGCNPAAAEIIQLHLHEAVRLARMIEDFSESELFAYFMDMGAGLVKEHRQVKPVN